MMKSDIFLFRINIYLDCIHKIKVESYTHKVITRCLDDDTAPARQHGWKSHIERWFMSESEAKLFIVNRKKEKVSNAITALMKAKKELENSKKLQSTDPKDMKREVNTDVKDGEKFGMLTVESVEIGKNGGIKCRCSCECGGERLTSLYNLKIGQHTSCGCSKPGRKKGKKVEAEKLSHVESMLSDPLTIKKQHPMLAARRV